MYNIIQINMKKKIDPKKAKATPKKKATLTRTVKKVDRVKTRNSGTIKKTAKFSTTASKKAAAKKSTAKRVDDTLNKLGKSYGIKPKAKKRKVSSSAYVNANKSGRR